METKWYKDEAISSIFASLYYNSDTGKWKSKIYKKEDSINFIKFLKKFGKRVYHEIVNLNVTSWYEMMLSLHKFLVKIFEWFHKIKKQDQIVKIVSLMSSRRKIRIFF